MIWTVLTLLSLVVLGGFISYYGDLQGRRWGKKRVSLFGLRPKHTAILITSLTGAFIALLSILTLLVAAPTVRDVILRGERAIRDNKRLNRELEQQRFASEAKLKEAQTQIDLTQTRLTTLQTNFTKICADLSGVKTDLTNAQKELSAVQSRNLELQKARYQLQQELKRGNVEIARLARDRRVLQEQNSRSAQFNQDLGKQNLEMSRVQLGLKNENDTLAAKNGTLTQKSAELQSAIDRLERSQTVLLRANDTQLRANEENVRQARELQARIRELTQKQEELYTRLAGAENVFTQNYNALRQGRLVVRSGEILARRTMDAHLRPDAVQRELRNLLEDASAIALIRGAKRGSNGRATRIITKRVLSLAGTEEADEQASLNALAENLIGNNSPVVVVVVAFSNSVEGEQAEVELSARTIKRVFRKGEQVASRRIDARKSMEQIVDAIVEFLQQDVRTVAEEAGTIPQVDPQTGAKQVGIFGPSDLVLLTGRVRQMGGQVQLTAYAAEDMNSTDPLRLTFKLTRPTKGK